DQVVARVPGDAQALRAARVRYPDVPVGVRSLGDDEMAVVRVRLLDQRSVMHIQDHGGSVSSGCHPCSEADLVRGAAGLGDALLEILEVGTPVVDALGRGSPRGGQPA